MAKTRVSTLLSAGLVGVPAGWLLARIVLAASGAVPRVPWVMALLLLFLAVLMVLSARVARGWISERKYDSRVDALTVARMLALGKAGSVFGAVVAGAYLGIGLFAMVELTGAVARERALPAAAVAVAGVVVAVAAYRLEMACRVPPDESDEDD